MEPDTVVKQGVDVPSPFIFSDREGHQIATNSDGRQIAENILNIDHQIATRSDGHQIAQGSRPEIASQLPRLVQAEVIVVAHYCQPSEKIPCQEEMIFFIKNL